MTSRSHQMLRLFYVGTLVACILAQDGNGTSPEIFSTRSGSVSLSNQNNATHLDPATDSGFSNYETTESLNNMSNSTLNTTQIGDITQKTNDSTELKYTNRHTSTVPNDIEDTTDIPTVSKGMSREDNHNESSETGDKTLPTRKGNSILSFLRPEVIKRLIEGLGGIPGMKDMMDTGLGVNQTQFRDINDFVQLLLKTTNTNPQSLSDVLSALQYSGLMDSVGGSLGNQKAVSGSLGSELWKKCELDISLMFNGLKNKEMWALKMLDASAKPGSSILKGHLNLMGNYKECQQVSHRDPSTSSKIDGNICRVFITPPFSIPGSLAALTGGKATIQWDVCLPSSCLDSDLNAALIQGNLSTSVAVVCTKDLDMSQDKGAIAGVTILSVLGLLLVAGTVMGFCVNYKPYRQRFSNKGHVSNGYAINNNGFQHDDGVTSFGGENGTSPVLETSRTTDEKAKADLNVIPIEPKNDSHKTQENTDSLERVHLHLWEKALLAFSIPGNTGKILSVKAAPGTIGCLHGMRVLSMAWVILGHVMAFSFAAFENSADIFGRVDDLDFQLIINATLSVDTFFVMSGLLTCYLFLKTLGKKGKITPKEFVMYYVHRYWRLTPSLLVWIMIVAWVLQYVGEGRPIWGDFPGAKYCRSNWWINLLYFNNVYKQQESCVGVTWFLAHDMQFYVIAPLALIPWLYGKAIIGFIVAFCYVGIHIASTIWLELKVNGTIIRNRDDYTLDIYFKPYTRSAPFAMGLMLGWILWKTKCQIKMNKCLVLLGWIASFGVILTLTLVTYDDNQDLLVPGSGWSTAGHVAWEVFYRPGWALAVCWIIFACAMGYGGVINSILSWEGWLPLSRLTYSAYLVHMTILVFEYGVPEYTSLFTLTSLSYRFIGVFVMSYAVGYLLTVAVESPMLNLEKVLLR